MTVSIFVLSFNDIDLLPEIAWNYGTSITHKFELAQKEMGISLDYYYTDFTNKVVVDYENPREISFYNLDGKSFSHSLQVEYNIEITKALELKAAYKWYNIKTTYNGNLKDKPLTPKNRALINRIIKRNRIVLDKSVDSTQVTFQSDSVFMYYPKISNIFMGKYIHLTSFI